MHVKVFIFKKFQGAQILMFFCKNLHEASFYIKEQTQILSSCVGFDSAIIDAQMLFWSVFFKMHSKKVNNCQKQPKWLFCRLIAFFQCVFKNTDEKDICASIVFKAEWKPKHEEKTFFGGFSSKTKIALFQGSKIVVFKTKISNLFFLHLFFTVRGSFMPIFTKKY